MFKDFYFPIILIFSIILGLLFAPQFLILRPLATIFLMIILFLAALKLNLKEIFISFDERKEQITIVIVTVYILIILPLTVYFITNFIYPSLAPALFILSLAPVGMTVPFLIDLMKGNKGLALILVTTTSLLAPFTIPFLISLIFKDTVDVNFMRMLINLAKIIFIPFILAWTIKYFFSKKIDKISGKFNRISTFLLGLLFATIIATHSEIIKRAFSTLDGFFYLIALFLLFIFIYIISFLLFYKIKKEENFTIIVCSVLMNFVLMIVIVSDFFYQYDKIIVPIILSIIPWTISLIILKYISHTKFKNKFNL